MKSIIATLSFLSCLALAGCITPLAFQDPAAADYGAPPENYEDVIKNYFDSFFYDSKSARYELNQPVKAYTTRNRHIDRQRFGWAVCGSLNRKPINRGYGGYEGPVPFFFLFQDGKVVDKLIGANDVAQAIIKDVCRGV